jgi:hypothetical protein
LVANLGYWPGQRARASTDPGLDLSIGVGSQCDSGGAPTATCTFLANTGFTVDFKVNTLSSALTSSGYTGYEVEISYSGSVSYNSHSLQQTGAGAWPGCVFPTGEVAFAPGDAKTACAEMGTSTHLGTLARLGFTCGSSAGSATLTLKHGDSKTDLTDPYFAAHSEATDESLTINCQPLSNTATQTFTLTSTSTQARTPTSTAMSPVPTGTATATSEAGTATVPPSSTEPLTTAAPTTTVTPTPTRTGTPTPAPAGLSGDANCDHTVNAIDAEVVLQFDAGLIGSLACPQNADVNHDSRVNSLDAALVLQYVAGLISHLPPPQTGCTAEVLGTPQQPTPAPTNGPPPTVQAQPTTTSDGLQIIDIQAGTGAQAQASSCVGVNYIGWLQDGTIFDSSDREGGPIQFPLNEVIQGWQEGVPGMRVGGTRRLIIPPALAYGSAGRGTIPPNATLTFDIDLISVR